MGFLDKMKQAKDMYGNMKKIQQELDKIECSGSSCGGKITAVVRGNHHIKSITIDDSLKSSSSNIEKFIVEAINDNGVSIYQQFNIDVLDHFSVGDPDGLYPGAPTMIDVASVFIVIEEPNSKSTC